MHAGLRAHIHVQSCACLPDGSCIAPDTIEYAKSVRSEHYCVTDTIASDTGDPPPRDNFNSELALF